MRFLPYISTRLLPKAKNLRLGDGLSSVLDFAEYLVKAVHMPRSAIATIKYGMTKEGEYSP